MIEHITRVHLMPEGEPIFSERAFAISIDDEAAGEFIVVQQNGSDLLNGQIKIDPSEWPAIRKAIDDMVSRCRL